MYNIYIYYCNLLYINSYLQNSICSAPACSCHAEIPLVVGHSVKQTMHSILYMKHHGAKLRQMKRRRKALQKHGGPEQVRLSGIFPGLPWQWTLSWLLIAGVFSDGVWALWFAYGSSLGRPRMYWMPAAQLRTKKLWRSLSRSRLVSHLVNLVQWTYHWKHGTLWLTGLRQNRRTESFD